MVSGTRRRTATVITLAVCVLASQGCVSGHFLELARRRERPIVYHEARLDGERLLLAYTAQVTDDRGRPLSRQERRSAVELADLRADLPVEGFPAEALPDAAPFGGVLLPIVFATDDVPGPCLAVETDGDGRAVRALLRDADGAVYPPLESSALLRTRTAPWVAPLLLISAPFDLFSVPALMLFQPAVAASGD